MDQLQIKRAGGGDDKKDSGLKFEELKRPDVSKFLEKSGQTLEESKSDRTMGQEKGKKIQRISCCWRP